MKPHFIDIGAPTKYHQLSKTKIIKVKGIKKGKMFLFGHTGITLGVASLWANTHRHGYFQRNKKKETIKLSASSQDKNTPRNKLSWFTALGSLMDIRLLLIGSLLPDIIDKPLGIYIFPQALSNGRIFSHTFLFLFVVTAAGVYLYRSRRKTQMLAISFGIFTHLVLDQMWLAPKTLFWPVYGLIFDKEGTTDWIVGIFHRLVIDPAIYIPELIGAAMLVWFAFSLVRNRAVLRFIQHGQIH